MPGGGLGLTDWKDAPEIERAREAGPNHPHQQTYMNNLLTISIDNVGYFYLIFETTFDMFIII